MEEKKSLKISLYTLLLLLAIIVIVVMVGFIYKLYKDKQSADSKISELNNEVHRLETIVNNLKTTSYQDENNNEIIKYELQTHEYFSDAPNTNKYFIDSENELNNFYSIYSDELTINKDYLKNNSIFIQVEQVGSGSIQMKLSSVEFDNNTVNFIIDKNSPEEGTMDMAFWYLVAIIPNDQLYNLNLSNWSKPSEILTTAEDKQIDINNYVFELDSKNKYTIITDLKWKTMLNDGGSHSSLYYQIDLDNNIICKVQEDYHANLGGTPSKQKNVIYIKKIDTNIQVEVKSLMNEIITKEDINETHNYEFFTISSLNTEKKLYNINTIENINVLLKKIDEFKN